MITVKIKNKLNVSATVRNRIKATAKIKAPINVTGENTMISVVVVENVSRFQPVTANGNIADSANLFHKNKVVGLAMNDILINTSGNVQTDGKMQHSAWSWTKGSLIYINGNGVLSQTPPTSPGSLWSQIIGIAYETDTIEIEIAEAYLF